MKLDTLENSYYYHIFNRGINSECLFKSTENKDYFLFLFNKYLGNKVDVLAYCLMRNHFHFVCRIHQNEQIVSQALSNFSTLMQKLTINNNREREAILRNILNENVLTQMIIYER